MSAQSLHLIASIYLLLIPDIPETCLGSIKIGGLHVSCTAYRFLTKIPASSSTPSKSHFFFLKGLNL